MSQNEEIVENNKATMAMEGLPLPDESVRRIESHLDGERLLRSARLLKKDFSTGQEGLTLASGLLFGTDETIGSLCPAYKTDAIVRLRDADCYDDRLVVRTNLVDAYDQLMGFCDRHLPGPFVLEGDARMSVRSIVRRELVSNLLIHREFTSPFPAKLVIDREGLRTENASRAFFEGIITLSNFNPLPKNPAIANVFAQIGLAEELGSGTRNLYRYARSFMGAGPSLVDGPVFYARIPDALGVLGGEASAMPDGFLKPRAQLASCEGSHMQQPVAEPLIRSGRGPPIPHRHSRSNAGPARRRSGLRGGRGPQFLPVFSVVLPSQNGIAVGLAFRHQDALGEDNASHVEPEDAHGEQRLVR